MNQQGTILLDTEAHIKRLKKDREIILEEKTRGAHLRCGARRSKAAEGQKPTKYFLNLEKSNYKKKTITRLKMESGTEITSQKEILHELKDYYEKLYTAPEYEQSDFVVNLQIPTIDEALSKEMEEPISPTEIYNAIKQLPNSKCPGTDGLPIDWYKVFYGKLKDFLLGLYIEIANERKMHISARRGIISLLEKPSGNPL